MKDELDGVIVLVKCRITKGNVYFALHCDIPAHGIVIEYSVRPEELDRIKTEMKVENLDGLIGKKMILKKKAA